MFMVHVIYKEQGWSRDDGQGMGSWVGKMVRARASR